jgi:multidrug efflux pump
MSLSITFDIGTDPDQAQVDVQNRVNQALSQLPDVVTRQGVTVSKRSGSFMMVIGVYATDGRYDDTFVGNFASLYVLDEIKRVPGANQASIMGSVDYAMRIWLKPDRMAQLGITAGDVASAIQRQNQQFGVGRIGQAPTDGRVEQTFVVTAKNRMSEPAEFNNIILRTDKTGAAIVRLKDVGHAELGQQDYSLRSKLNGRNATIISVYAQPGANAIDVSKNVKQTLAELKKSFPDGIDYAIAIDTTKFIEESIHEVVKTFFEACALVVLVVFLFLQSLRATLIPILAVPVSLVGTFCGMYLLGFSINMLTLFGMILAIGIVVDDAIVVIENVERNMNEFGLDPKAAAMRAMEEVTGPVITIVLVLISVFIPVAFLGGMTGQLYKQFAITIAISVVISGIVALTLSPALAALLLKPGHREKRGFFKWFEAAFDGVTRGYTHVVRLAIKRTAVSLALFGAMLIATFGLFRAVPGSFVPPEDQGYLLGAGTLPGAASLDRTEEVGNRVGAILARQAAVKDTVIINGFSLIEGQLKTDSGTYFVSLKDFAERKTQELSASATIAALSGQFSGIREALVIPINPPSIPGLGAIGGFEFWIQNRGVGGLAQLEAVTRAFVAKAGQRPELSGVSSTISSSSQQLLVELDRDKAEILGVPVDEVFGSLQTLFGSNYVSQFNKFGRVWQVIVQADPKYRSRTGDIERIYVRSRSGKMVPLSAVVTTRYVTGPDIVSRFNGFVAARINGNAGSGYSSGQAIRAMEQIAAEALPPGFSFAWSGEASEEKKTGGTSSIVFGFGLIMVFLILAAQYEKWSLPFGVMLAVPFGLFGALVAVWARGMNNDVYFQIGLVTLIALAAKNAILIVEFAVMKRDEGMSIAEAAVEAARLRLRPIVMTSFAFILGCVPLMIASGAGAASRHSIGTGVVGGMLGATLLAIFFVPMFFLLLETMSARFFGGKKDTPAAPGDTAKREHD